MPLPVVLIHGYSTEGKTVDDGDYTAQTVGEIYGRLVQDLTDMGQSVVPVNVSRYVSLDDGIGIDDLSLALHRALRATNLLETGFNAVIHSTGALVARNWVRRHSKPDGSCPLKRLVHLAGANFGSGWAHVGATQFARFARAVQGVQPGVAVLHDLELASNWAIDLHTHFLEPGQDMLKDYGVMEFSLVGSQVPPEFLVVPVRYGREDGSDGVMRVSASNLNFNYVEIVPTETATDIAWDDAVAYAESQSGATPTQSEDAGAEFDHGFYTVARFSHPDLPERTPVPFAIPYNTCHTDFAQKTNIVTGADNRQYVLPLIEEALKSTPETYATLPKDFDAATAATYDKVRHPDHDKGFLANLKDAVKNLVDNPKGLYDPHAHLVIRVRDHLGGPVNDFSVFFNSFGSEEPDTLIDKLFEDSHKNGFTANTMDFYLRTNCWDDGAQSWTSRLGAVNGVSLEIDAVDPTTHRVLYLPLRLHITEEQLVGWIQPHRTTIIDVRLMRLPHKVAFILR